MTRLDPNTTNCRGTIRLALPLIGVFAAATLYVNVTTVNTLPHFRDMGGSRVSDLAVRGCNANVSSFMRSAVEFLDPSFGVRHNQSSPEVVSGFKFLDRCLGYVDAGQAANQSTSCLFIGILSAPQNSLQRSWCRWSWSAPRKGISEAEERTWPAVRFIVGRTTSGYHPALLREAAMHRDIILIDSSDGDYETGLPAKTFGLMAWFQAESEKRALGNGCTTPHFFKTDDDAYVSVRNLLTTIDQYSFRPKRLRSACSVSAMTSLHYGGSIHRKAVARRTGKWAVSREVYERDVYPDYASGMGYVLSLDAVRCALVEIGEDNELEDGKGTSYHAIATRDSKRKSFQYRIGSEDVLVSIVLNNRCPCLAQMPVDLAGIDFPRPQDEAWHWKFELLWRRMRFGQIRTSHYPPLLYHHLRTWADFEDVLVHGSHGDPPRIGARDQSD